MSKFYYYHLDYDDSDIIILDATNWQEAEKEVFKRYKNETSNDRPSYVRIFEVVKEENISLVKQYKKLDDEKELQKKIAKEKAELARLEELAQKYNKRLS